MPAKDPEDQAAARDFEHMLRYYVYSGRSPQSKLDWFIGLPKRVRRSRRLIGEALGPYEEARERAREENERRMARELDHTLHLAALRAQPRDLSCLKRDGTAWQGIGRRKKRCRVFHAIGKAFARQQGLAAPLPVLSLDAATPSTGSTTPSTGIPTPEGLRQALYNCTMLTAVANGPATYGLNTPRSLLTPSPAPTPCPPPAYPTDASRDDLTIFGENINPDFAFIVATGRHSRAPGQGSLREAAFVISEAEEVVPGLLGALADLLFPDGVGCYDSMVEPVDALFDFCCGWFELARGL